eukprot:CAMPEP_0168329068 /NCGR_PEP_ID=MMETSP0213-20121227/6885_1 /TAXON_ID=151035 /ORGANISM="Euplotes harpa, Strain FSP1.4" /LENGTH=114 /DNA_ID=CAMNT_0008332317 /DNA_START=344 /DNA_END=688 /DNA_ORIENTATION=+
MNAYYEKRLPEGAKPKSGASQKEIDIFIRNKYVRKLWVDEQAEDPVEVYRQGRWTENKQEVVEVHKAVKDEKGEENEELKGELEDLIDFGENTQEFGEFQVAFEDQNVLESMNM